MLWNAKNGAIPMGDAVMHYAAFGSGSRTLVLLPGLAFDLQGGRMGYGGGFYDRFLAGESHPTVALCYGFQLLPQIPLEEHDLRVTCIISTDEWR